MACEITDVWRKNNALLRWKRIDRQKKYVLYIQYT